MFALLVQGDLDLGALDVGEQLFVLLGDPRPRGRYVVVARHPVGGACRSSLRTDCLTVLKSWAAGEPGGLGSMILPNAGWRSSAVIPCQFNFEIPSTGIPWKMYSAGTARA
ncbi:hypothetical protein [Rugosimonospora africana]|uniref:hypothetical protein n=1 Tax=Rugosimonospora africana TaxID=556532 RepID=UPI001943DD1E|nr:hypothetical protein [Rugosimonospora africana]